MKKSLVIGVLAASLSFAAPAWAYFNDTTGHWAQNTIDWGQAQGYVHGYPDGSYKPNQTVSEAEFLSMLVNATKGSIPNVANPTHWADSVYAYAKTINYPLQGYDSVDARNQPITRTHVAELETATLGLNFSGDEAVKYLLVNGYATGKTGVKTVEGYEGSDSLTRAEAITFIKNLKDKGVGPIISTSTQNQQTQTSTPQNPTPTSTTTPTSTDSKTDLTVDQMKDLEMKFANSLSFDNGALTGTPPVLGDRYEWNTVFSLHDQNGKRIVLDWNKKFPQGEKFSLPVNWGDIEKGTFAIEILDKQSPGASVTTLKYYPTAQIEQRVN